MKQQYKWSALLGFCGLSFCFAGSVAFAQPVDCSRPALIAERFICNDEALKQTDQELAALYEQEKQSKLLSGLYANYVNQRNDCTNKNCVDQLFGTYQSLSQDIKGTQAIALPDERKKYQKLLKQRTTDRPAYIKRDEPWARFALATFDNSSQVNIIDAVYENGVLYVFVLVDNKIYEFADNRDEHFVVFDYTDKPKYTRWQEGYAAIKDGYFYFNHRVERDLSYSYRYKLGTGETAQQSALSYVDLTNLEDRNSWGKIENDYDKQQMTVSYWTDAKEWARDIVAQEEHFGPDMMGGWTAGNFVWSAFEPVFYFDNIGNAACIWRTDLIAQETVKIVPEHEAIEPKPLYLGQREAVIYVEEGVLKIAVAPRAAPAE